MDSKIKALAEAVTNVHIKSLIQTHVKDLTFNEETRHLMIHLDNVAPARELETKEGDRHLNKALVEVYGDDITYEMRTPPSTPHERDKIVSKRNFN